jgi:hypothetical protein
MKMSFVPKYKEYQIVNTKCLIIMLENELCTKVQRILSIVNTKCLCMTNTKNFCITCTRVLLTVASGDNCGGSYHCGDIEARRKIGAPWLAFQNDWVS